MRGVAHHTSLIKVALEDIEGEDARLQGMPIEWWPELTAHSWGRRAFGVRDPEGTVLTVHTVVEEANP
jgi:uncharacterized glyoxalase superfamily protein PhnB